MTVLKSEYSSVQDFTMTHNASLAIGHYSASASVDNTSDLFDDVLIYVKVAYDSNPTGDGNPILFAYSSLDGTNWLGSYLGFDGTDKTGTWDANYLSNFSYSSLSVSSQTTVDITATLKNLLPFNYYEGVMPPYWGIVLVNNGTTLPFSATGTNFKAKYMGVYAQAI